MSNEYNSSTIHRISTEHIQTHMSRQNGWGKETYADIIEKAIRESPERKLYLSEIYEYMIDNYEYFRRNNDKSFSSKWKNSVRHNLSLHRKRFKKIGCDESGKSSWWTLTNNEDNIRLNSVQNHIGWNSQQARFDYIQNNQRIFPPYPEQVDYRHQQYQQPYPQVQQWDQYLQGSNWMAQPQQQYNSIPLQNSSVPKVMTIPNQSLSYRVKSAVNGPHALNMDRPMIYNYNPRSIRTEEQQIQNRIPHEFIVTAMPEQELPELPNTRFEEATHIENLDLSEQLGEQEEITGINIQNATSTESTAHVDRALKPDGRHIGSPEEAISHLIGYEKPDPSRLTIEELRAICATGITQLDLDTNYRDVSADPFVQYATSETHNDFDDWLRSRD